MEKVQGNVPSKTSSSMESVPDSPPNGAFPGLDSTPMIFPGGSSPTEGRPSWANIVSTASGNLQKHNVAVQILDGITSANIPDEILQDPNPLWKSFIIGRFLDKAPHVAKIHVIVNKIWNSGEKIQKIDVHVIDDRTIKFRIQDTAQRNRILRRGLWNIADVPMVVCEWSPEALKEQPVKSIPVWVDFKNVPGKLLSHKGLGWLASHVGHLIRLHPLTEACSSFDKAKIFVEVKLDLELPKRINLTSSLGVSAEVQVEYSWLPPRCSTCKKWGHKECVTTTVDGIDTGTVEHPDPKSSPKETNQTATARVEMDSERSVDKESQMTREASPKTATPVEETGAEAGNTEDATKTVAKEIPEAHASDRVWTGISPGRKGKNNGDPERIQKAEDSSQIIVLPSRYNALQEVEEEEICVGLDTQTEDSGKQIVRKSIPQAKKGTNRFAPGSILASNKTQQDGHKGKKNIPKEHVMSGFFWNVRGFNKTWKHKVVRTWTSSASVLFGCLLETRVKENNAAYIFNSTFPGWDLLTNYEHHRLSRIWVVWNDKVVMTPLFKSSQMITCSISIPEQSLEFFCSFVYASNFTADRAILWEDL